MLRYAAIDIGSNAVRLLIADISNHGKSITYKKNTLVRVPLRLGDDAFLDQYISPKKEKDLLHSMKAFRHLLEVYHVDKYRACATSALREAKNGGELIRLIKEETALEIEIIDGQQEASLIYANHIEENLDQHKNYLYIDVGGGSTELSLFINRQPIASRSFNIGTIRMLDNQDRAETWEEMKNWLKTATKEVKNLAAIGTGGNINKLFRLSGEKEHLPLSFIKLKAIFNQLNAYSLKERIGILHLNYDRADVIIPAGEIYLTIMKWSGIKSIYVPKVGLADGIIQQLIDEQFN